MQPFNPPLVTKRQLTTLDLVFKGRFFLASESSVDRDRISTSAQRGDLEQASHWPKSQLVLSRGRDECLRHRTAVTGNDVLAESRATGRVPNWCYRSLFWLLLLSACVQWLFCSLTTHIESFWNKQLSKLAKKKIRDFFLRYVPFFFLHLRNVVREKNWWKITDRLGAFVLIQVTLEFLKITRMNFSTLNIRNGESADGRLQNVGRQLLRLCKLKVCSCAGNTAHRPTEDVSHAAG